MALADEHRSKSSVAQMTIAVTLLLQLAGLVWGASSLSAKVDYSIDRLGRTESKIDALTTDLNTVRTDIAVLKTNRR